MLLPLFFPGTGGGGTTTVINVIEGRVAEAPAPAVAAVSGVARPGLSGSYGSSTLDSEERVLTLGAENRIAVVGIEVRTAYVASENRTIIVPAE